LLIVFTILPWIATAKEY